MFKDLFRVVVEGIHNMQALGALSPIEKARGDVQEKIADFLAARARLGRLMKNSTLEIQGQANSLYAVQTLLETQLQNEIYPKLQVIQSGTWTFSDIALLGGYTYSIMNQIDAVNRLDARAGGVAVSTPLLSTPIMIGLGLFLFAGGMGLMSSGWFSSKSL